jgi:hypothetical protein
MEKIKLFGETIRETIQSLKGTHLAGEGQENATKAWGRIIVSIFLLAIAAFCLAAEKNTNVASTIIGALIGYWVK